MERRFQFTITAQDHLNYIYYWTRKVTYRHFHKTRNRLIRKALKLVIKDYAAEALIKIDTHTSMRIKTFKYEVRITPYLDKWETLEKEINKKIAEVGWDNIDINDIQTR